MISEKVILVLQKYAQVLNDHGVQYYTDVDSKGARVRDRGNDWWVNKKFTPQRRIGAVNFYDRLEHLAWMCVETQKFVEENRLEKAFRWLGFIQGSIWAMGLGTIEEMKQDNMSEGGFNPDRI